MQMELAEYPMQICCSAIAGYSDHRPNNKSENKHANCAFVQSEDSSCLVWCVHTDVQYEIFKSPVKQAISKPSFIGEDQSTGVLLGIGFFG